VSPWHKKEVTYFQDTMAQGEPSYSKREITRLRASQVNIKSYSSMFSIWGTEWQDMRPKWFGKPHPYFLAGCSLYGCYLWLALLITLAFSLWDSIQFSKMSSYAEFFFSNQYHLGHPLPSKFL
jgi:hypothetical protein